MSTSAVGEYCNLNGNYTFDRFVEGENSSLAVAAARAVADRPAQAYNPLFLHGQVGLGKTHLLHAIGHHLRDAAPWMRVVYITSERFTNELLAAIRDKSTPAFRQRFRRADVLLVDDIHFLKDRAWTQEELFHTFNELHESQKQIVLTSDRPPEELSQLQDRLVSRFRWGLVAEIQPPALATRLAILRVKARELGLALDPDVLEAIARRVRSSVRALEGALIKVAAHLELSANGLTRDRLDELLPAEKERTPTLEQIKAQVARYYGVSVADLEGHCRVKAVSHARQMAIYLAREYTNSSFPALGQAFGGRNHSTIMHAYKRFRALVQSPLFRHELEELRARLL